MKIIGVITAILLSAMLPLNAAAQAAPKANPASANYRIPSANPQALGLYSDVPVSLYTGTPEITIPIYEIKIRDFSLPISLSYHASGVKVAQEASWVGLGWALNAGGMISRTIRDIDDFKPIYGFTQHSRMVIAENERGNLPYNQSKARFDRNNTPYTIPKEDFNPDLFTYNFAGYSGKFVFRQGGYNIVNLNPENLLQMSYDSNGFTITAPDGVKYRFKDAPIGNYLPSSVDTHQCYVTSYDDFNMDPSKYKEDIDLKTYSDDYLSEEVKIAWYLTEIELLSGEKITFKYDLGGSYRSFMHVSHELTKILYHGGYPNLTDYESVVLSRDEYPQTAILSSIQWSFGDYPTNQITFYPMDRTDLRTATAAQKCKAIKFIKVITATSDIEANLGLDYFGVRGDARNSRLKLKNISITGTGISGQVYDFTYYDEDRLPAKDSWRTDRWGYANGAGTQKSLIPKIRAISDFPSGFKNINAGDVIYEGRGADRECNPNYLKAAVLQSITYPTGAVTKFQYEPHSYKTSYGETHYGGGLRLSYMKRSPNDASGELGKAREFMYGYVLENESTTSGKEIVSPELYGFNAFKINGSTGYAMHLAAHIKSDSHSPLETSVGGNPIGYSRVHVIETSTRQENYYHEISSFYNTRERRPYIKNEESYVIGLPNIPEPLNGTLIEKVYINEDSVTRVKTTVKSESYTYTPVIKDVFTAYQANQYWQGENYTVNQSYPLLTRRATAFYGRGVTEIEEYTYKNFAPVISTRKITKGKEKHETYYNYSGEYNTPAFQALKAQGRGFIPVVETEALNEGIIKHNVTTYKIFDDGKPHPYMLSRNGKITSIRTYDGSPDFYNGILAGVCEQYNEKGDCTSIKERNGQRTFYVYSPYSASPSMTIKGDMTYQQIQGINGINPYKCNPSADPQKIYDIYPKAHISCIYYNTNGTVSQTISPTGEYRYFSYDAAERIKQERDHNSNILKEYKYNNWQYKQPKNQ